jgi:hypothetical protein
VLSTFLSNSSGAFATLPILKPRFFNSSAVDFARPLRSVALSTFTLIESGSGSWAFFADCFPGRCPPSPPAFASVAHSAPPLPFAPPSAALAELPPEKMSMSWSVPHPPSVRAQTPANEASTIL